MKIVFDPKEERKNRYIHNTISIIEKAGIEVFSLSEMFSSFSLFKEIKIVHLNWYESLNGYYGVRFIHQFCVRCAKLLILKAARKKIVWTMHNKASHVSSFAWARKCLQLMILELSDKIVIHSELSREILTKKHGVDAKKVFYVPHVNYVNNYGPIGENVPMDGNLNLLFLGAVRPYKNIELLIDAIKELNDSSIGLKVAGWPLDSDYAEQLTEYASGVDNIVLEFGFVNDDQLSSYLAACDLLALPYNVKSSLNSGTIIMAFSYAKTVIAPLIGTVADMIQDNPILTYSYDTEEEHKEKLKAAIMLALSLKKGNRHYFEEAGQQVFREVVKKNAPSIVLEYLSGIYRN